MIKALVALKQNMKLSLLKQQLIKTADVVYYPSTTEDIKNLETDFNLHLSKGLWVLLIASIIIIGVGGFLPLASAVIVNGTFMMISDNKKIQHDKGGIVKEIYVHDGSKVHEGENLARLDETVPKTTVQIIGHQIDEIRLHIARLSAERDKAPDMTMPPTIFSATADYEKLRKSEVDFFRTRQQIQQNIAHLSESKIAQLKKQITGLEAQLKANGRQKNITASELADMEELYRKRITTRQRVNPLKREDARLEGVDGQIISNIQENYTKIGEIKLQALQSEQNFRSDVMHDLNVETTKIGQLLENFIAASQELSRTVIKAPVAGIVQELNIHTIGGVLSPAEALLTIVPDETLEITAKLPPNKIDQVKVGQPARIKLTALERTTPEISGTVKNISPALIKPQNNETSYYEVKVSLNKPSDLHLIPGMPAEVYLDGDIRTLFSYLMKPIADQLPRMFKER